MHITTGHAIALTTLLSIGCAGPAPESTGDGEQALSTATDIESIRKTRLERFAASFIASDTEGFLAAVVEGAVLMPPDESPVVGHAAIRAWLDAFFAGYSTDLVYTGSDVTVAGNWAFEAYAFRWTLTPVGDGAPIHQQGKGVYVFQRQPDGSWKVARDIWNFTPDADTS